MKLIELSNLPLPSSAPIGSFVETGLTNIGLPLGLVIYAKLAIYLFIAICVVAILQYAVKAIINFVLKKVQTTTNFHLLNYAIKNKLAHYIALLAPYTFIRSFIPILFTDFQGLIKPAIKIVDIYLVLVVIWTISAIIKSFINLLQERPAFENKPMQSYMQVFSIILYSIGAIVTFAILTNQSPGVILAGLGAASAVTMLVFQDSIKGFVGSIQMTTNNMVELGDWITVAKHNADGSVEEINLTTVKIRNFDKTITTVPTYSLISDSFQNWKPMQDSGGRRLKRTLFMKQGSIRFMKESELEKYKELPPLKKMIDQRMERYKTLNKNFIENHIPITNNDLFMAYTQDYLDNHPEIHHEMTCMFRQLSPTPEGLPLEVYVFTNTVDWAEYERISTEIMNHLIGMVSYFDLMLYEILSDTSKKS